MGFSSALRRPRDRSGGTEPEPLRRPEASSLFVPTLPFPWGSTATEHSRRERVWESDDVRLGGPSRLDGP